MRRLIVLSALSLMLASCASQSDVPSEVVLNRSTQANSTLDSAAFDLDVLLNIPGAQGTTTVDAAASGVMQHGGTQLEFSVEAEGSSPAGGQWSVLARFIVAGMNEVYAKVDELSMPSASAGPAAGQLAGFTGKWWLLPTASGTEGQPNVTPDPRMLRMQTEAIDVLRDRGIVSINGRQAHHYDVAVNPEKLATFLSSLDAGAEPVDPAQFGEVTVTGELWIDAETYILRRAEWRAESPVPGQDPLMTLYVDISDHNTDLTVSPPADAQPLPALQMLPIPLT